MVPTSWQAERPLQCLPFQAEVTAACYLICQHVSGKLLIDKSCTLLCQNQALYQTTLQADATADPAFIGRLARRAVVSH